MLHSGRRPLRRDAADRGAAAMAFVLLGAFGALVLTFMVAMPLLLGTEQSSRAQTAADAAALGGAEEIRDLVLDTVEGAGAPAPGPGSLSVADLLSLGGAAGYAGGERMATGNGAQLVSYRHDDGRVDVHVRLSEPGANGTEPVEARASADLGLDLRACRLGAEREPEPTPSPTPTPTATPTGEPTPAPSPTPTSEPTSLFSFSCDGRSADGEPSWLDLRSALRDVLDGALQPRLVD